MRQTLVTAVDGRRETGLHAKRMDGKKRAVVLRTENNTNLFKGLMLYTRLAPPIAMCIAIPGRYTRLAWLANPNPSNHSYGYPCVYTASRVRVYRHFLFKKTLAPSPAALGFRAKVRFRLVGVRNVKTVFFNKTGNWFEETGNLPVIGLSLTPSPLTLDSRPSTGLPSSPTGTTV